MRQRLLDRNQKQTEAGRHFMTDERPATSVDVEVPTAIKYAREKIDGAIKVVIKMREA